MSRSTDTHPTQRFELIVIGGGSAGYAAARTARDLGAKVAIVDQGPLGGLCILRGCMPSKALLASADAAQRAREAHRFGIQVSPPKPHLNEVLARKRALISGFAEYRSEQLENFPLFLGQAHFISPKAIIVDEKCELEADRFIIATGSVIAPPPIPGLAHIGFTNSDQLLDEENLPNSIICLGGGYIASELGQYMHRMGVNTELIMRAGHLLSNEDADVGMALTEALRKEGMTITTNVQLQHAELSSNGEKALIYEKDGTLYRAEAEEIASFLGRLPAIAGLQLEVAGVRAHPVAGIEVDAGLRTSQPHIYAVGDVTGLFQLVHVAIAQGELAAKNALRVVQEPADYRLQKARTIFTEPQVAIAGQTERELLAAHIPYLSASYPYADHGKAMTLERREGFVKMLASPHDGRILGAAIVGAEASELIHEILVAMYFQATVQQFIHIPHLHPTLAEIWTYPAEELVEKIGVKLPAAHR